MTYTQRNTEAGRILYNQLRLNLAYPGEVVGGERRPYTPVNKDHWTWENAMAAPDTENVATHRLDGKLSWLVLGKYRQVA